MRKNENIKNEKKIKKFSVTERRERRITSIFSIPSVFGVLLFFILPFIVVIYYSMINNVVNKDFVFMDNFIALIKNAAFQRATKNTMTFSLIAVPLAVVIPLCLALLLDCKIPYKTQFRTIFITPMMVPVASIVLICQVIFHHNGAMNEVLQFFGFKAIDWFKSDYSQVVVVVLYLWKNIGYNMILFMAALSNIPVDIIEYASLEGCGSIKRFFYIKLRYLSSSLLFVTILSLINSFKVFREVYLLTDNYPYDTLYMLQHFMNNTFSNFDYQKLSAAAIIMCIAMIIIIGVLFIIDNRVGKDIEE
jgi:ABC-type sugar transport systems, permease components